MSNTLRRDKNDKVYKESLKKREAHYRCKCKRCVGKNNTIEKIADKKLKTDLKEEIEEGGDCDNPKQDEILEQIMGRS